LICHILSGHGDLVAREKESMGGATPPMDQMAKIEQVAVVGQTLGGNYSLQHFGLLKRRHKTHIG